MIRYGLTIFISAFLLFQIQPIIARFILPWFGGTAAVWTTCLMFFQLVLLAGYLYAHLLRKFCSPRATWTIHLVVLLVASLMSWIVPSESLQPDGTENLTIAIVTVLGLTVGLPFFALSTTGPLIQAWQSSSHVGQSPYRLYALSNVGSMLALLTYPFLIERFLPLASQAKFWTAGFLLFGLLCCWSGWQTIRLKDWTADLANQEANGMDQKPQPWKPVIWVLLSMAASIVLLATTNLMCQEVASVPFLWILPLSLYLLSFIICFDRPAWYKRAIFLPLLVFATVASLALIHIGVYIGISLQIAGLALACFAASMACHGELERLKPATRYLTSFYLWISVGGALGGIFVCVIAPHLFTGFCEFHVGYMICLLLAAGVLYSLYKSPNPPSLIGLAILGLGVMIALGLMFTSLIFFLDPGYQSGLVFRGRNEYGLSSVVEDDEWRRFVNGQIEHGAQARGEGKDLTHNSYYVPGSGVGVAFESMRSKTDRPLRVGVLGLGAGAMTTWLQPGDEIDFYEINPMVEMIARKYFTFLDKSPGKARVILGDGRIQLKRNIDNKGGKYDLLFMDAFASDAIPVHLLTRECMGLYEANLNEGGMLVIHITNRFIDLRPVVLAHADDLGYEPILINYQDESEGVYTRWVLFTKNQDVLKSEVIERCKDTWDPETERIVWTDDYASVAALLHWSAPAVDWYRLNEDRKSDDETEVNAVSPERSRDSGSGVAIGAEEDTVVGVGGGASVE